MTINTNVKSSNKRAKNAAHYSKLIEQNLSRLTQEYNISYLGIFGSYIRGEQKEDSDLDILVEFSKEPDLLEFIGLKQELSEILGVEVDLVMKNALKPRIGKRILEEVMQI